MTAAEFANLASLLPGSPGRSREAGRRVLVDGLGVNEAAREVGIKPSAVSRLVTRVRWLHSAGCPTCGRPVSEDCK